MLIKTKNSQSRYDGSLTFPFGVVGILTQDSNLIGLEFLPPGTDEVLPKTATGNQVWNALFSYMEDPNKLNEVALASEGTDFQKKVWNALRRIPAGEVMTYGELAKSIDTSPRAAANACRRNRIPILIPCHRIVAQKGLGGYCGETSGYMLDIKIWLLQHEGYKNKQVSLL